MSKKSIPPAGQPFVGSLLGAFAFIVLGLLALTAIAYAAGVEISDVLNNLNSSLNRD